jgi:DNA replication and repair protein RecF
MGSNSRPASILRWLRITNLRGYVSLDLELGPGPQLIYGPNAAGKTTLLEAVVLLATGGSHRTSTDAEMIRWGAGFLRVEGMLVQDGRTEGTEASGGQTVGPLPGETSLTVALAAGSRKKIAVNGVPRRPSALAEHLRAVVFAPEEMLLIVGPPSLRRTALDELTGPGDPAYASNLATYGRALQQRNSLLRAIREGEAGRDQLQIWDEPFVTAGAAVVASRLRALRELAEPLAAAHREIAPAEERLAVSYESNAAALSGEAPRDALARRLRETAEKEVWNGSTLVGPHRDDLVFSLAGRDLVTFSSRGQQRTAILAFKLAEMDVLTALDGRPPLLLLDDVFSELDPERRAHLVRRISELPQALVTATDPMEIDPALRRRAHLWRVAAGEAGALVEAAAPEATR